MKISGIVITLNEENNISDCLKSMRLCCDELVVVDSGSTDRTVVIASQMGARVLKNDWDGFGPQKNFALNNATHDWILSMDADERMTIPLASAIKDVVKSGKYDVYSFERRTRAYGKWIKYSGWGNDYVSRLFKRKVTSFSDDKVHEKLNTYGLKVKLLRGHILHFRNDCLESALSRMDQYSSLWAEQNVNRKAGGVFIGVFKFLWTFFRMYFLKLGVLDGKAGMIICFTSSFGSFAKYVKLFLLQKSSK